MSDRKFEYTIDADEMAASGVRTVDLVEVDGARVVEVKADKDAAAEEMHSNMWSWDELAEAVVAQRRQILELETELKIAQGTIADLRDANERAFKIQAEEANKKLAEVEARLKEANTCRNAAMREHSDLREQIDRAIDDGIADTEEEKARRERAEADAGRSRAALIEAIGELQVIEKRCTAVVGLAAYEIEHIAAEARKQAAAALAALSPAEDEKGVE